jgi:hypothetical protein
MHILKYNSEIIYCRAQARPRLFNLFLHKSCKHNDISVKCLSASFTSQFIFNSPLRKNLSVNKFICADFTIYEAETRIKKCFKCTPSGMDKFFKNLEAISKFYEPGGWKGDMHQVPY